MASASSASLRESEGGAPFSGVQGQSPWAEGLGDAGSHKLITFSQSPGATI